MGRLFSIFCEATGDFPEPTNPRNSNVSKILPVTTFRTIDLEGKKNSDSLFSRFCEEPSVFFGYPKEAAAVAQLPRTGKARLQSGREVATDFGVAQRFQRCGECRQIGDGFGR